jgi:hypothetical protein
MKRIILTGSLLLVLFALIGAGCKKTTIATKNPARLEALIVQANQTAASATEGPDPGVYPVGAKHQLQLIIDSARTLQNKSVSQSGIDLAEILLQNALTNFKGSVQVAKQLYFDGTGYLNGGLATAYNTPYITLEAWIYPTEFKNAMYIISTEGTMSGYKLQIPNGTPTFVIGVNGTSTVTATSSAVVKLNEWAHVAATFDGTNMKVYVNGKLTGTKSLTYKIVDNGENFRIGEGSKFTARTFKGRIRDVSIWDHALNDVEIAASLTNKIQGMEVGLTAYWPFNLSAGTSILDRTGKHSVDLIKMIYIDPI